MVDLIQAASALVFSGDRLLFVRSTRTGPQWAFPGGRAEPGETREQTAVREVREEVGLDIELTGELGRYVTPSGFEIACFVAVAGSLDLAVESAEIIEARWCSLEEGLQLDLTPTAREALNKFASDRPRGRT